MNQEGGDATLFRCFGRSLIFRTISDLKNLGSVFLLVKGLFLQFFLCLICDTPKIIGYEDDLLEILMDVAFMAVVFIGLVFIGSLILGLFCWIFVRGHGFMKVWNITFFSYTIPRIFLYIKENLDDDSSYSLIVGIIAVISVIMSIVLLIRNFRSLKKSE